MIMGTYNRVVDFQHFSRPNTVIEAFDITLCESS